MLSFIAISRCKFQVPDASCKFQMRVASSRCELQVPGAGHKFQVRVASSECELQVPGASYRFQVQVSNLKSRNMSYETEFDIWKCCQLQVSCAGASMI